MTISQNLIRKLLETLQLNAEVTAIKSLQGGMSANVTLIELELSNCEKARWIIRQYSPSSLAQRSGSLEMEFGLHKILNLGGLPVSRPIFLDKQGAFFELPSLVVEYIPGETNFSIALPYRGERIARILAQIHSIDMEVLGDLGVPPIAENLEELCGPMPTNPDESLNETLIRAQLAQHWPPKYYNPSVLLHGDMWNGNLLWNRTQISGLIDWEDAAIGDPLVDLAGMRSDLAYTFGANAVNSFTRTYLRNRKIDTHELPLWDLVSVIWLIRFINHDLQKWAEFFHGYGRMDITADSVKLAINAFSRNALEKLALMETR